jgi:hypothetical protein
VEYGAVTKLNNSDRIKIAFVAGHVRRWHASDVVSGDRVDSHTWGMLAIIHILHPSPSVTLLGAVTFHDSPGERYSGDIPHGAKVAFPALGAADKDIGERAERAIGVHYELDGADAWWLRFADMAQALLFIRRQIAQGNSLLGPTLDNCTDCLEDLNHSIDAPIDAASFIQTIINCRVDLPMSNNLALLESLAS